MLSLPRRLVVSAAALVAVSILPAGAQTVPAERQADRFSVASGAALRDRTQAIEAMERYGDLRLREVQEDTLVIGRVHQRLDQYYKGVRVFGGDVVRETDGKTVLSLTGTLYAPAGVDSSAALDADKALAVFASETASGPAVRAVPELVVLPKDDGTFVLAWRVTAFVNRALPVLFVNAATGRVELRYDNLQTQQPAAGIGKGVYGDEKKLSVTRQGGSFVASDQLRPTRLVTYDLRGDLTRMLAIESGLVPLVASDIAVSGSVVWEDPAVVDAHCHLGWSYDYFFKRFGWRGLDNRDGRTVQMVVHPARRQDFPAADGEEAWSYFASAHFCAQCGQGQEDVLMLGEGMPTWQVTSGGQSVTYLAASLDVVAHEYAHGIMASTSRLVYRNESGALSEAFSDVMAAGVEFSFQPPGEGLLKADYLQGEESFVASRPGSVSGIRSLADPGLFGHPDHYSKKFTGTTDGGGVHANSSIVNHAFYLAIEGGANRTSGLEVHGVGAANREQIEKVFFRALVTLPADATFSQARARAIQSARDLYPASEAVERAVTEAWTAVGVE